MEREIADLRRQFRVLKAYAALLTVGLLALLISGFTQQRIADFDLVRTKGLVVIDQAGRDRILMGAPVPDSKHRVRSDLTRAKKHFQKYFPGSDMKWYDALQHGGDGIVMMDEKGFDSIVLGSNNPDPTIGKRIGSHSGLLLFDTEGFERGGYGYFPKLKRGVLTLDHHSGKEGVALMVLEDGTSGLLTQRAGQGSAFLGYAKPKSWVTKSDEEFHGLLMREQGKDPVEFNLLKKKPH